MAETTDPSPKRLTRRDRLRSRRDISRAFDEGTRAVDRHISLQGVRNDLGRTRLAVAVSKRHGPAVRRNRLKRLGREAYRQVRCELPAGLDLVLLPRAGRELSVEQLRSSLRSLARRVDRSLGPSGEGESRDA